MAEAKRTSDRLVTGDAGKMGALRESVDMEGNERYGRDMHALGCTTQEITQYVGQVKEET